MSVAAAGAYRMYNDRELLGRLFTNAADLAWFESLGAHAKVSLETLAEQFGRGNDQRVHLVVKHTSREPRRLIVVQLDFIDYKGYVSIHANWARDWVDTHYAGYEDDGDFTDGIPPLGASVVRGEEINSALRLSIDFLPQFVPKLKRYCAQNNMPAKLIR